jgi:hypothetical protein
MGSPVVGVLIEECEVVGNPDQRTAVAGKNHHRAAAEDRVDGATLIAELAEVRPAENGVRVGRLCREWSRLRTPSTRQACGGRKRCWLSSVCLM